MKKTQLTAVAAGHPDNVQIVLAEKETLDRLTDLLLPSELQFLHAAAEREVKTCFFPRAQGAALVRLFAPSTDPAANAEDARLAGNDLLREIRQYKIERVTLHNYCRDNRMFQVAEGMALGNYQFLKYYTRPEKKEHSLREICLAGADPEAVAELDNLLDAVCLTRSLVNEPHSHFTATDLARAAEISAQQFGFEAEVLGMETLENLKMGGLLAVNQASDVPAQFIVLHYCPETARETAPIVLIGKGVVYDTGGLSLKPSDGMDYMKCDMAGAATVIGAIAVAAKNKLPVRLIGLIPATDNKIGERAMSPGDVIRMYSGDTVEVVNTDAEGRLILADALHYAKQYQPALVLDFATLTGAAVRALGSQAICYMGTAPQNVKSALEKSGWNTYERLVELPLWKEYGEELKSNIADLRNLGAGNAGMITAGKFLQHFAGDMPWLHLDIAGPAYLRHANGYRTKEGTGVGVRLLYDFLKNYSASITSPSAEALDDQ
ncbi:MAG: leucyl aminopeptidase family protein [Saprospiraceae bacterium]|nr:leucyl aminopeptidase family protein [Saprospiraceae bacterium]